MPFGGAMHEMKNIKDSKVPVNALYSAPFRDDTEVHRKTLLFSIYTKRRTLFDMGYFLFRF